MNDSEYDSLVKVYQFAQKNNMKDSFANTYISGKAFIQDETLQSDAGPRKKISKKDLTDEEYLVK